ncbi:MAG: hypothetical protein K6B75_05390 [Lachnospiraceae bacterium]|nr:hypothetical protein [Lachnospiraceae bacterium]
MIVIEESKSKVVLKTARDYDISVAKAQIIEDIIEEFPGLSREDLASLTTNDLRVLQKNVTVA